MKMLKLRNTLEYSVSGTSETREMKMLKLRNTLAYSVSGTSETRWRIFSKHSIKCAFYSNDTLYQLYFCLMLLYSGACRKGLTIAITYHNSSIISFSGFTNCKWNSHGEMKLVIRTG